MTTQADLNLGRIGRCIYCGSTRALQTEHVIPKSLGGGHYLLEASCPDCAARTSRLERFVARDDLLLFRSVLGLPTYRPSKRPTSFRGRVRRGDVWTEEDIPLRFIAGAAIFPRLPVPGGWEQREAATDFRTIGGVAVTAVSRSAPPHELARAAGIDEVEIPMTWNPATFARVVAKVAYGFAVNWAGLDRLTPGVLGVILGDDPNITGWVGSPPPGRAVFSDKTDQTFAVRVHESVHGLVTANVRLFAAQGAPEYFVIVGMVRWSERWCDLPADNTS